MASLRDKTISSVFWSALQKIGSRGVSLIASILLARLLTPKDFGLIGMLTVFIAVSQTLVEGGFNKALIQKKEVTEEDFSSVFYINLVLSCFLYIVLFFTAPLIANFYEQPILVSMTRVLSLVFVINAFSYVQRAKLERNLRFKTLMFIHLPSTIISGVVAIIMALTGFGVWSIVGQQIVMRVAYTIQIWIYAKWKPLLLFNKDKAKELFKYGGNLMVVDLINTIYKNIYLIVIGRFYSAASLGFFQNAQSLIKMPTSTLSGILKSVTFPVFSSIQDDKVTLKKGYKKAMQQLVFWLAPIIFLAVALADPLFRFVLTDKWLPAVPYFRVLSVLAIFGPLNAYNQDIINVKGESRLFLKINIWKKIITTIGIIVTIPFGVFIMACFRSFTSLMNFFINTHYSGGFINYKVKEQLRDIMPTLLLSAGIAIGVYFFNRVLEIPDILRLIIGFGIGIGLYWFITFYFKFSAYKDVSLIVNEKIKPKITKRL